MTKISQKLVITLIIFILLSSGVFAIADGFGLGFLKAKFVEIADVVFCSGDETLRFDGLSWSCVDLGPHTNLTATDIKSLVVPTNLTQSDVIESAHTTFVNISGDSMTGNLSMSNNSILNINALQAIDGSKITFGSQTGFTGLDQAIVIETNQTLGEGIMTHCLLDQQGNKVIACWQSGKNGSWAYNRNSLGVFPDFGITNATFLASKSAMWNTLGIDSVFSYDSSINETSIASAFGFEGRQIRLHNDLGDGGIMVEGFAEFGMAGNIFVIVGGDFHQFEVFTFEQGFNEGDIRDSLNAIFPATLDPFVNEQVDDGNWIDLVDATNCDSNECAMSNGDGGAGQVNMSTNFTTSDTENYTCSFVHSLTNFVGGSSFEVYLNNQNASGWMNIYTNTTTGAKTSRTFILDAGYSNLSTVGMRFVCDTSQVIRECFVDTVICNGSVTQSTTQNVTGFNSTFLVGDGSQRMRWNDITKTMEFPGNTSFEDVTIITQNITGDSEIGGDLTVRGDAQIDGTLNASSITINGIAVVSGTHENLTDADVTSIIGDHTNLTDIDINDFVKLDYSNKSADETITGNRIYVGNVTISTPRSIVVNESLEIQKKDGTRAIFFNGTGLSYFIAGLKLGIGTLFPNNELEVRGTINATIIKIKDILVFSGTHENVTATDIKTLVVPTNLTDANVLAISGAHTNLTADNIKTLVVPTNLTASDIKILVVPTNLTEVDVQGFAGEHNNLTGTDITTLGYVLQDQTCNTTSDVTFGKITTSDDVNISSGNLTQDAGSVHVYSKVGNACMFYNTTDNTLRILNNVTGFTC